MAQYFINDLMLFLMTIYLLKNDWWQSLFGPLQFFLLSGKGDIRQVAAANAKRICARFIIFSMTFR